MTGDIHLHFVNVAILSLGASGLAFEWSGTAVEEKPKSKRLAKLGTIGLGMGDLSCTSHVFFGYFLLLPRKLTWNLKMMFPKKKNLIFQRFISGSMLVFGGVSLRIQVYVLRVREFPYNPIKKNGYWDRESFLGYCKSPLFLFHPCVSRYLR